LSIHKLRNNVPITKEELTALENMLFTEEIAGTKQQFVEQYGEKPLGAFIRSVTGVEQSVLNEAFANFLQVGELRADQMTFINTIISYLSKNGTIDVSMLYSSPFIDINHEGIDGVFDLEKKKEVVRIIDQINYNAIA
jgi:type I restriction enzyme R subunit